LAELNERLSYLQTRNDPSKAEEFVRLYQERMKLLKQLDPNAAESLARLSPDCYSSRSQELQHLLASGAIANADVPPISRGATT